MIEGMTAVVIVHRGRKLVRARQQIQLGHTIINRTRTLNRRDGEIGKLRVRAIDVRVVVTMDRHAEHRIFHATCRLIVQARRKSLAGAETRHGVPGLIQKFHPRNLDFARTPAMRILLLIVAHASIGHLLHVSGDHVIGLVESDHAPIFNP